MSTDATKEIEYLIAFVRSHGVSKYIKRNYIKKAIEVIDGIENRSEMG
jgi:hypothetical protein